MQDAQQRPWHTTKNEWREVFEEHPPELIFQLAYEQSEYGARESTRLEASQVARRNGPCPCGSGRKYERCCA